MIIPGFQWFKRLLACDGVLTIQSRNGKRIDLADTPNGQALFLEEFEPEGWQIVPTESQVVEVPERKPLFGLPSRRQMMPLDSGSA